MSKARDIADLDFNSPDIDGGNIDGAVIGGTTPAAGTFDAVTVNGPRLVVQRQNDDSSIAFANNSTGTASGNTWAIGLDYDQSESLTFAFASNGFPSLSGSKVFQMNQNGDATFKGNVSIGPSRSLTITNGQLELGTNYRVRWGGSNNYSIMSDNNNYVQINAAGEDGLRVSHDESCFNDGGVDRDFRVESDGRTHALFVEGSSGNVALNAGSVSGWASSINAIDFGGAFGGSVASLAQGSSPYGATYLTANAYLDTISSDVTTNWKAKTGHFSSAMVLNGDGVANIEFFQSAWTTADAAITWKRPLRLLYSEVVFNEDSYDVDFRVESDTNTHALFVNAENSRVGINNNAPGTQLDVTGGMRSDYTFHNSAFQQTGGVSLNYWKIGRIGVSGPSSGELIMYGSRGSYSAGYPIAGKTVFQFRGGTNANVLDAVWHSEGQNGVKIPVMGYVPVGNHEFDIYAKLPSYCSLEHTVSTGGGWTESLSNTGSTSAPTGFVNVSPQFNVLLGNYSNFLVNQSAVIVNEDSYDVDFRVESNNNAYMLFVDSGTDRVGINDPSPSYPLDVNGAARIRSQLWLGSDSNDPGILSLNDNSGSAYSFNIKGTGTREYTFEGSSSGASYNLHFKNALVASGMNMHVYGGAVFNENGDDFDFRVESNNNPYMIRVDGGNDRVGIGANTPQETLEVRGGSTSAVRVSGGSNTNNKVQIGYDVSDGPYIKAGSSGITKLQVRVDNTTLAAEFRANGDFYSNDGTVHSLSDARVKTDIHDLVDGLDVVKQLKPRTFKYTQDSEFYNESKKDEVSYGFVANEVEEVAPQYTSIGKGKIGDVEVDDLKSLSTTKMIPMLVKAIQEQQEIIESLQSRITALEN